MGNIVTVAVVSMSGSLNVNVEIVLNLLDEMLQGEGVWSLNGEAEGSAPDLSGHYTEGTGNTEEDGVVVELVETVVHQEGTWAGINIGPGVLDLACCLKNLRDDLVAGLYEVNEVIVLDVLVSKLDLAHEARVSLAEDGVTVAWDNFAWSKSIMNILSNVVFIPGLSKLGL